MNKDNAKDYLPLVQALAEGRQVQINVGSIENPDWIDRPTFDFSAQPRQYRIKPEPPKPREWTMWEESGKIYNGQVPFSKKIRVREIIEESNQ